jgi:hypothetical protein
MHPEDGENSSGAGISLSEPDEYQALIDRLRGELERGTSVPQGGGRSDAPCLVVRDLAERSWIVSFDRPVERRPGLRGALTHPLKLVLRRLMRWYVEPFAAEQRTFNDAVLKLLDDLEGRVTRLEGASGK